MTFRTISGESLSTVTPGSAETSADAAWSSVTVIVPVLVWVGSEMPTAKPVGFLLVMMDDGASAVIRSTDLVPGSQKFAATTPSDGFLAACTAGVLASTTMSGLDA